MSKFQVGDRVKVVNNPKRSGTVARYLGQTGTIKTKSSNFDWHLEFGPFNEDELELAIPAVKIGDHVKATRGESIIVGEVYGSYPEGVYVRLDGEPERNMALYTVDNWTIEVLPEPITLPTKRFALIGTGTATYIRGNTGWTKAFFDAHILTPATLLEIVNRNPKSYRVIFPGKE